MIRPTVLAGRFWRCSWKNETEKTKEEVHLDEVKEVGSKEEEVLTELYG